MCRGSCYFHDDQHRFLNTNLCKYKVEGKESGCRRVRRSDVSRMQRGIGKGRGIQRIAERVIGSARGKSNSASAREVCGCRRR